MEISIICVPPVIGIPRDGNEPRQRAREGMALGPRAVLDAGLVGQLQREGHVVDQPLWIDSASTYETGADIDTTVRDLSRLAAPVSSAIAETLRHEKVVIVLEGNCSHGVAAVGGLARAVGRPGVAWFDAHPDLNTRQTSTTHWIAGMPFAVILGWDWDGWRAAAGLEHPVRDAAAALVGVSDPDESEIQALREHAGIVQMNAAEMQAPGVGTRLAALLLPRAVEASGWYLHIDMDVFGKAVYRNAATWGEEVPSPSHLIEAASAVAHAVPVRVISLAAFNPGDDERQRTAQYGISMVLAALAG